MLNIKLIIPFTAHRNYLHTWIFRICLYRKVKIERGPYSCRVPVLSRYSVKRFGGYVCQIFDSWENKIQTYRPFLKKAREAGRNLNIWCRHISFFFTKRWFGTDHSRSTHRPPIRTVHETYVRSPNLITSLQYRKLMATYTTALFMWNGKVATNGMELYPYYTQRNEAELVWGRKWFVTVCPIPTKTDKP